MSHNMLSSEAHNLKNILNQIMCFFELKYSYLYMYTCISVNYILVNKILIFSFSFFKTLVNVGFQDILYNRFRNNCVSNKNH